MQAINKFLLMSKLIWKIACRIKDLDKFFLENIWIHELYKAC